MTMYKLVSMTDHGAITISTTDALQLYELKLRWDGHYHVSLTDGTWRAIRDTDALAVVTADSGGELGALINADYAAWAAEGER
jgi:hypothetical protein